MTTGAAPAAIASSSDIGRSVTGTTTAPRSRQGGDALRQHAAAEADACDTRLAGALGDPARGLAERGLLVDAALRR